MNVAYLHGVARGKGVVGTTTCFELLNNLRAPLGVSANNRHRKVRLSQAQRDAMPYAWIDMEEWRS